MKDIFPIKAFYDDGDYEAIDVRILSLTDDRRAIILVSDGRIKSVDIRDLELTDNEIERFFGEEDDN